MRGLMRYVAQRSHYCASDGKFAGKPPRRARAACARRYFAIDANATLMLAQASTPAAATIAKSAIQTYIDGIRDLAELVV